MNVVREIERLNERELQNGVSNTKGSWHYDYTDTNWVFVGSLEKNLSEGDVICVFSQFGEIEDLNLARDEDTGESKGFSFVKFEAWESTVLAVDNMNGVELVGRTIRVDHARYEPPKKKKGEYIEASVGHAYTDPSKIEIMGEFDIHQGVEVFKRDKKTIKSTNRRKQRKPNFLTIKDRQMMLFLMLPRKEVALQHFQMPLQLHGMGCEPQLYCFI